MPKPDFAGRTALRFSTLEFLDCLATILPPPRIPRHRSHGVFAPNAPLRPLVTERGQEDNALTVQVPGPRLPLPTPPTAQDPKPEAQPHRSPDTVPSRSSRCVALLARPFDHLDQTPESDPADPDPEPVPDDDFGESRVA